MKKIRYYNDNVGANETAEKLAFNKAIEISFNSTNVKKIILLVSTKRTTDYIERIFNKPNLKKFFDGNVKTDNDIIIQLETIKTISNDPQKNIIVAFGLDSNDLYQYDDFENTVAIIAHQWGQSGVKDWAETWSAINIESNKSINLTKQPDSIVCIALDCLSRTINVSTGLGHGNDDELCKTYIRTLKKYNYPLNSKEVSSYLITKHNWSFIHSQDVTKLIDKINSGGYFHGGKKTGLKKYLDNWKAILDKGS